MTAPEVYEIVGTEDPVERAAAIAFCEAHGLNAREIALPFFVSLTTGLVFGYRFDIEDGAKVLDAGTDLFKASEFTVPLAIDPFDAGLGAALRELDPTVPRLRRIPV